MVYTDINRIYYSERNMSDTFYNIYFNYDKKIDYVNRILHNEAIYKNPPFYIIGKMNSSDQALIHHRIFMPYFIDKHFGIDDYYNIMEKSINGCNIEIKEKMMRMHLSIINGVKY